MAFTYLPLLLKTDWHPCHCLSLLDHWSIRLRNAVINEICYSCSSYKCNCICTTVFFNCKQIFQLLPLHGTLNLTRKNRNPCIPFHWRNPEEVFEFSEYVSSPQPAQSHEPGPYPAWHHEATSQQVLKCRGTGQHLVPQSGLWWWRCRSRCPQKGSRSQCYKSYLYIYQASSVSKHVQPCDLSKVKVLHNWCQVIRIIIHNFITWIRNIRFWDCAKFFL